MSFLDGPTVPNFGILESEAPTPVTSTTMRGFLFKIEKQIIVFAEDYDDALDMVKGNETGNIKAVGDFDATIIPTEVGDVSTPMFVGPKGSNSTGTGTNGTSGEGVVAPLPLNVPTFHIIYTDAAQPLIAGPPALSEIPQKTLLIKGTSFMTFIPAYAECFKVYYAGQGQYDQPIYYIFLSVKIGGSLQASTCWAEDSSIMADYDTALGLVKPPSGWVSVLWEIKKYSILNN